MLTASSFSDVGGYPFPAKDAVRCGQEASLDRPGSAYARGRPTSQVLSSDLVDFLKARGKEKTNGTFLGEAQGKPRDKGPRNDGNHIKDVAAHVPSGRTTGKRNADGRPYRGIEGQLSTQISQDRRDPHSMPWDPKVAAAAYHTAKMERFFASKANNGKKDDYNILRPDA